MAGQPNSGKEMQMNEGRLPDSGESKPSFFSYLKGFWENLKRIASKGSSRKLILTAVCVVLALFIFVLPLTYGAFNVWWLLICFAFIAALSILRPFNVQPAVVVSLFVFVFIGLTFTK